MLTNEGETPHPILNKQKDKEDLEEIVTELELVDEEEKVPFVPPFPLPPLPFPPLPLPLPSPFPSPSPSPSP